MHYVFVYGTLRKGESNDHFLTGATCITDFCWTKGELYDTGRGYPALKDHPSAKVIGELYEVTDVEIELLDELEGYIEGAENNLYERQKKTVYSSFDAQEVFVYIGNSHLFENSQWIESGDWKNHRQSIALSQSD